MKMKFPVTTIFYFALFSSLFGQTDEKFSNGYLVFSNNDTLFGNMKLEFYGGGWSGKPYGSLKVTLLDSLGIESYMETHKTNILAYKNDVGIFVKKKIPFSTGGGEFMELISKGKILLYKNEGVNAIGDNQSGPISYSFLHYYIEKGDKFIKVKPGSFGRKIKSFFTDDAESVKKFKNKMLNWTHIPLLVEDYNKRNN